VKEIRDSILPFYFVRKYFITHLQVFSQNFLGISFYLCSLYL
jgi:hypothetical protein